MIHTNTTHTCVEVSIAEGLQDVVHGSHVEDEAQLGDGHGHQAQDEERTGDAVQERLGYRWQEGRRDGERERTIERWISQ